MDEAGVIKVWCRGCNKKLGFPAAAVGRRAKCPACGMVFVVEAQAERAASNAANLIGIKHDLLRVECPSCSKVSKFKFAAAGKKARCSACDEVYYVPQVPEEVSVSEGSSALVDGSEEQGTVADFDAQAGTGEAQEPPMAELLSVPSLAEEEPAAREGDELYDILVDAEQSAASAESDEDAIVRMQAATATKSTAATSRSKPTPGVEIAPESEPNALTRLLNTLGPLGKGVAFSCTGAIIGAFIWYGIARATDYEIGYVAWGVGVLAGLGMHLGVRAESGLAGALAALIALGGVLMGKVMVAAWVILPLLAQDAQNEAKALDNDVELQREEMVDIKAEQILKQRGLAPEKLSEQQEEQIQEEAEKRVERMKDAEVRTEYKAWKAAHPEEESSGSKEVPTGVVVLVVALLFGFRGIIFSILAMVSAYKIGRSGLSFSGE